MALINKAYNALKNVFQKHNRNFITPDEYIDGCKYVQNKAIRQSFDFLNNIKNNSKVGRVVKVDYDKERFYKDVVRKLLSSETLTYNAVSETFELPSDYSLCQSIYYSGNEVEEISNDERFISNLPEIAVDDVYPIYLIGSTDIEIIPDTIISGVKMYYYRQPNDPKWTYVEVSGKPVFDADQVDFQDFELPDSIYDEIIRELALYFALELKQPDVYSAMDKKENESEQIKRSNQ